MIALLKYLYIKITTINIQIYTWIVCQLYGLDYDKTWRFKGRPIIQLPSIIHKNRRNAIKIGTSLQLNSRFDSNSIGAVQPVLLNAQGKTSKIIIGNNVGISGSTISAMQLIKIGNDVLIGSGCLIMDNDAHNISATERHDKILEKSIKPIFIENNVFIGARSIILKGVTIGENSVIGAGSVVSKSIPSNVVAAGNPAIVIKNL